MQMIKDRLEHRTSHGYRNRVLIMSSILATWDAELVDSDGMLILPAPSDEVLSFFGLLLIFLFFFLAIFSFIFCDSCQHQLCS